jgi:hypothetical protein
MAKDRSQALASSSQNFNLYRKVMHSVARIIKVAKINRHSQQLYNI